ncbi:MAG: cobalamin biosynthesis protein CobW [Candidatus Harrisonbacteria bacterium CG10_big_fil_rev_8_21_14_0_10_44_23]|uniref:Cobalamin biosynthesis protein CobW n=1 Tax=Candidatus Harrisonbacteria bacterium CG10_big_fil_rev_8_21_14_0_10_44_23 TaxID=1974585 RepID=A0A2H0USA2_9BACT|nr:MAG: cobalamin biosynthesis protein CobW [Candidatus Harrisonbacteria bacterium CG10_big_fil_rev_8_21_14_0_10_44_23]
MLQSSLNLKPKRKPVTIITGFLGSGKTTLLKRILEEKHGQKIAVIVNEFGEVGIDDKLIVEKNSEMVKMTNGCICCTMQNETSKVLINLLEKGNEFDRVVIETTGLANPLPIMRQFLSEEFIKDNYQLDGVVSMIDAFHIESQLDKHIETKEQIAYSDLLLLNKTDLIDQEKIEPIKTWLHAINPSAPIIETQRSSVAIKEIFDLQAKSREAILQHSHNHQHIEDSQITSFVLEESRPIAMNRLNEWLNSTLLLYSGDLLRYKGIFYIKDRPEKIILQGVHTIFEKTEGKLWTDDEEKKTELVIIGRGLDKDIFEQSFKASLN